MGECFNVEYQTMVINLHAFYFLGCQISSYVGCVWAVYARPAGKNGFLSIKIQRSRRQKSKSTAKERESPDTFINSYIWN